MKNKFLYKDIYDILSTEEQHEILDNIASHYGFTIKEYKTYSCWNITTNTAIFDYNGCEFVFVPGCKNVSLGWSKSCKLSDDFINLIKGDILNLFSDEIEQEKASYKRLTAKKSTEIENKYIYDFVDLNTSFKRIQDIPPMLVERKSRSIFWEYQKTISTKEIADNPYYLKVYQEILKTRVKFLIKDKPYYKKNEDSSYIKHYERYRYTLNDKGLNIFKFVDKNIEDVSFDLIINGFNIPNESQWEYLCGAGCNTLFPWGNIPIEKDFLSSNFFGIYIAEHANSVEIIQGNTHIYKGGIGYNHIYQNPFKKLYQSPYYLIRKDKAKNASWEDLCLRRIITLNIETPNKISVTKKTINNTILSLVKAGQNDKLIYLHNNISSPDAVTYANKLHIIKAYQSLGFYNKALNLIKEIQTEGSKDYNYHYIAGINYAMMRIIGKAVYHLKQAVTIKRNFYDCWQLLANMHKKEKDKKWLEITLNALKRTNPEKFYNMLSFWIPEGIKNTDIDYEDIWDEFVINTFQKYKGDAFFRQKNHDDIILFGKHLNIMVQEGIFSYIKKGYKVSDILNILKQIQQSDFIKDITYFDTSDVEYALECLNIAHNIFEEIDTINIKSEYAEERMQNLTNVLFDYTDGIKTLAYIHFFNSSNFEADKLFDKNYIFCADIYQNTDIPYEMVENIQHVMESLVSCITLNIYNYKELLTLFQNYTIEIKTIYKKYVENVKQWQTIIEKNIEKDISYIIHWFGIELRLQDINSNK